MFSNCHLFQYNYKVIKLTKGNKKLMDSKTFIDISFMCSSCAEEERENTEVVFNTLELPDSINTGEGKIDRSI